MIDLRSEVARIVDAEWAVEPRPSTYGRVEYVEYIPHIRPLGELAPYWRARISNREYGIRPRARLDVAILELAVARLRNM